MFHRTNFRREATKDVASGRLVPHLFTINSSIVGGSVGVGELAILVKAIPESNRTIGVTNRDNWQPTLLVQKFTGILNELAADTHSSIRTLNTRSMKGLEAISPAVPRGSRRLQSVG